MSGLTVAEFKNISVADTKWSDCQMQHNLLFFLSDHNQSLSACGIAIITYVGAWEYCNWSERICTGWRKSCGQGKNYFPAKTILRELINACLIQDCLLMQKCCFIVVILFLIIRAAMVLTSAWRGFSRESGCICRNDEARSSVWLTILN